jgi:hypothetical protein
MVDRSDGQWSQNSVSFLNVFSKDQNLESTTYLIFLKYFNYFMAPPLILTMIRR